MALHFALSLGLGGCAMVNGLALVDLLQATDNGKEDVVRLLLEHGSDPNLQDTNGNTALMQVSVP